MYLEEKLVQKCLLQIEEGLGWGPSQDWHNDVFIELSERIQERTKVLLSPVTLKRVWGRIDYRSAPSKTTLNTLAQFAGFENWRDFKGTAPLKTKHPLQKVVNANLGIIMLSASVMTVIFISFFSLKGTGNDSNVIDPESIMFKSKPIAKGLPNTVVFDLDLGGIDSDSIHIQQYWDPTKTISLKPGQTQATGQYYSPGYFRAKLLVDGKPIKQHDLFIKSEGWLGTLDYQPIPNYIQSEEINDGKLSFPTAIFDEVSKNEQPINTTYHLVQDFDSISGDNFILKSSLQNVYRDKWAVCQKTYVIILGTKGAMVYSFSIPGCSSELGVMMNDVYFSGKEHDLSGLGLDLSETRDIKIQVMDKQVEIFAEDNKIFAGSYNESIGRVVGIRYRFLGLGEVYKSELQDVNGSTTIDFLSNEILE
ncbi:hypothetical protein [Flagellimonas algicola]|uniref:PKD domain-containing protein n=1 Tax=Flagellimonas algicola TaxID=2583815 RepID=A0ABY2WPH4_9FLAO|nr:hypothetical protein [Allomuricauda algicola]TMU56556.1 hypothetical protein FGG15_03175 [Allomuricauda algicola]